MSAKEYVERGEAPNLRAVRTCFNCENSEGYPDVVICSKYYNADIEKVCDEHSWDKKHMGGAYKNMDDDETDCKSHSCATCGTLEPDEHCVYCDHSPRRGCQWTPREKRS